MRRILVALAIVATTGSRTAAQTPEQIERLVTLGKVWGFLKYYHPGVATGPVNWDGVAVDAVTRARAAGSAAEFNAVLQSLFDAAGPVVPCAMKCAAVPPDSLRMNVDLRWLSDSRQFSTDIVRQLEKVRDNHHVGQSRYVKYTLTATFDTDTAYDAPAYPDEGVRVLALYRFWNAARYFFPYMYVNDGDWNTVLPEFIPRLIAAKDAAQYHLTLVELTTRLRDTHVGGGSPEVVRAMGSRFPPFEPRFIEGKVVVWRLPRGAPADGGGLKVGDVITQADGVAMEQRRRDLTKYVAAGNQAALHRKLVASMLRERGDSVTYTIDRDGKSMTLRAAMAPVPTGPTPPKTYPVTELARMLPNSSIGYINMGDINTNQVDSAIAIVKNATGIVMDVRNYPRGTMYMFANFFNPTPRAFVKFTSVDTTYPGAVKWTPLMSAGLNAGNPDAFKGRVAILVDERTQSHAEFSVMALRTAPQNRVIGSQTAGADGNITRLSLPSGFRTLFTGLGVFYPDGTKTQRIGIVPDIEVRPTLKGLRAGRDEVLERAIQYLESGR